MKSLPPLRCILEESQWALGSVFSSVGQKPEALHGPWKLVRNAVSGVPVEQLVKHETLGFGCGCGEEEKKRKKPGLGAWVWPLCLNSVRPLFYLMGANLI